MTGQSQETLVISGGTLFDAVGNAPVPHAKITIREGKIASIESRHESERAEQTSVIDASGKFIIPGLMNANVHLLGDVRLENLCRHMGRFEGLILEAAQVSLKSGLTTVFDTWGPRRALMNVRDRINNGQVTGSRIYCAGNIIGMDGPYSPDFISKASEMASPALVNRINAMWVENSGRHLIWKLPKEVATEVQRYIATGIDFVKYASNEHHGTSAGAFISFSLRQQRAIVDTAHAAGRTAQAHVTSVEGLHLAVEAGCDLLQHANLTGPTQIPDETLDLMRARNTSAVVFPSTERGFAWIMKNVSDSMRTMMAASEANAIELINAGVPLLMANDGSLLSADAMNDPKFARITSSLDPADNIYPLATGHFVWLEAMQAKGLKGVALLKAATSNIARAYGVAEKVGTIEVGKCADMLILDKDPLLDAANYRSIRTIVKDGAIVDPESLPGEAILTKPMEHVDEEKNYKAFFVSGQSFPWCPLCMFH